jgi:hypothetical protein
MTDETIFAEIEALLDNAARPGLDELEHTLTAGYAAALALEAERWRIERRIADAAGLLGAGEGRGKAQEIARLARRLNATDGDLGRLRAMLGSLRERADAERAA